MNRTDIIIPIIKIEDIPTIDYIKNIPRNKKLFLIFYGKFVNEREIIGQKFKEKLNGFSIGIHVDEPIISVRKLITDEEIEANQDFFEKCAKDCRKLAEELIFKLGKHLKIEINTNCPHATFRNRKAKSLSGRIKDWSYFFHGYDCHFVHLNTKQSIEVPLTCGLEFGVLDPHFFITYIESTPEYKPLPIEFFEDFADGCRVFNKMISLGKFEEITSNFGYKRVVVTDRPKIEIKFYEVGSDEFYELYEKEVKKQRFNFWKFIGLKK